MRFRNEMGYTYLDFLMQETRRMNGTCCLKPVFYSVRVKYQEKDDPCRPDGMIEDTGGIFGPYSDRYRAEECCTKLATRSDVLSAEIIEDVPTTDRFKEEA